MGIVMFVKPIALFHLWGQIQGLSSRPETNKSRLQNMPEFGRPVAGVKLNLRCTVRM